MAKKLGTVSLGMMLVENLININTRVGKDMVSKLMLQAKNQKLKTHSFAKRLAGQLPFYLET